MNTIKKYSIKDAHCGACIEMIKKAFSKVKGVQDMSVDFDEKEITVYITDGYDEATALNAVAQQGYQLERI